MTTIISAPIAISKKTVKAVQNINETIKTIDISIEDLNIGINKKMDELFDLLLQHTLKSNEVNIEICKSANGPSFLIQDMEANNPVKFRDRIKEIKEGLRKEFLSRYDDEMWMDYMDSQPTIPTEVKGYHGWNLVD